jgi:hypothetical protein
VNVSPKNVTEKFSAVRFVRVSGERETGVPDGNALKAPDTVPFVFSDEGTVIDVAVPRVEPE